MLWKIAQAKEGIKVTFNPSLLFGSDSASLTEQAEESIRDLVRMLAWCQDMNIVVEAWTDSTIGTRVHRDLSWKQVTVVADFARELGLKALPSAPTTAGTASERFDSTTIKPGDRLQSNE